MQKTLEINWEEIPQEYNYVAMNNSGIVTPYVYKPSRTIRYYNREVIDCDFWVSDSNEPDWLMIRPNLNVEDPENYNWKTLYERPSIADRDS